MRRALVLPALLSLLFVVLIAARALTPAPPVATFSVRPPPPVAAGPLGRGAALIATDVATILGRPLFTANRRPPTAKSTATAQGADPRLSAIYVTPTTRRAVFDDGGSKPLVASVGGVAGPFHILAINPSEITVETPSGRRTLRPRAKASDGASATDASATPGEGQPEAGMSLLQQIQRNGVGRYPMPSPPSIQSLMDRLQHRR